MLNRECVDRLIHEEERLAWEKTLQKAANRGSRGGSRGRGRASIEADGSSIDIDPLSQFYLPSPAPAQAGEETRGSLSERASMGGAEADEEAGVSGLAGWGQCHSC